MKTAEEWYAENPSLSKIDFGGVIGLIERIQQDAQPVWQPIDTRPLCRYVLVHNFGDWDYPCVDIYDDEHG